MPCVRSAPPAPFRSPCRCFPSFDCGARLLVTATQDTFHKDLYLELKTHKTQNIMFFVEVSAGLFCHDTGPLLVAKKGLVNEIRWNSYLLDEIF